VAYTAGKENRYWIIWNDNAEKDFVAIEPQTWLTNAMKLPDPLKYGAIVMSRGETWVSATNIAVRRTADTEPLPPDGRTDSQTRETAGL
jgi:galactose mutarotase-like enzyme